MRKKGKSKEMYRERECVGVWGGRKLTGDLGWNYGNAIANYYYYLW